MRISNKLLAITILVVALITPATAQEINLECVVTTQRSLDRPLDWRRVDIFRINLEDEIVEMYEDDYTGIEFSEGTFVPQAKWSRDFEVQFGQNKIIFKRAIPSWITTYSIDRVNLDYSIAASIESDGTLSVTVRDGKCVLRETAKKF